MKRLRHFIWLMARPFLDLRQNARVGRLIEDGATLHYPARELLAAQYWNGEFNRKEIAVCQLAMDAILNQSGTGLGLFEKLRLEETPLVDARTHWRRLLEGVFAGSIDLSDRVIEVDPSLHLVRGAHWLVLALHFGIAEVRLQMFHKAMPQLRDEAWLAQRGFSNEEIAQVDQALEKMLTRFGATRLVRPDLKALHEKIDGLFGSERQAFGGKNLLYQSCEIIERAGQRPTDLRFATYGLESVLRKSDHVLDIGCNCGFFALKVAGYAGQVDGIEITPSLVQIGETVADFLRISNCTLRVCDFHDFKPTLTYNLILSFAVHFWVGLPMPEYAARLRKMLAPAGLVLLESQDLTRLDLDFDTKLRDFCLAGFREIKSGMLCDDGINLRRFVLLQSA